MPKFITAIERLSNLGGQASAICILLMTFLILLETIMRAAADKSIFIAEEYSAYLMANFVVLGLAYTLKEKGHIRVNLVLSRLQGGAANVARLAACLLGFFIFAVITWQMAVMTADSWTSGQQSMNVTQTPVFLPQSGLVLGSMLMTLQFVAGIVKEILLLSGCKLEQE